MKGEIYKIRYAKVSDARALAEIHVNSWQKAYKGIIPDEVLKNITVEKREKYFTKVLTERTEDDAIIFKNNEAVGFITIGKCRDKDKTKDYGEVWGVYLLPDYWRKGVGCKLIKWGLEELRKRDYKKVTLWVLEKNSKARNFYEKIGFNYYGTVNKINIGENLNECRYEMVLD